MELSEQKSECRRLHGSFNCHSTGVNFRKSSRFGKEVSNETTHQVQKKDRDLFYFKVSNFVAENETKRGFVRKRFHISHRNCPIAMSKSSYLKFKSSIDDWFSNLSNSRCNEEACRNDTNDGCKWQNLLNESREELVGSHTDSDRSQNDLQKKSFLLL